MRRAANWTQAVLVERKPPKLQESGRTNVASQNIGPVSRGRQFAEVFVSLFFKRAPFLFGPFRASPHRIAGRFFVPINV
jgi:hypothetical protein